WFERLWNRTRRIPSSARHAFGDAIQRVPEAVWDRLYAGVEPILASSMRIRLAGDKAHKLARVIAADTPRAAYVGLLSQWKTRPASAARDAGIGADDGALASLTERLMLLDQTSYLPDDILAKVDRASMAVSLEVRVPLLDHRLVEWAWRLPLALKRRGRVGKWL